jgi:hypothetical protein
LSRAFELAVSAAVAAPLRAHYDRLRQTWTGFHAIVPMETQGMVRMPLALCVAVSDEARARMRALGVANLLGDVAKAFLAGLYARPDAVTEDERIAGALAGARRGLLAYQHRLEGAVWDVQHVLTVPAPDPAWPRTYCLAIHVQGLT